MTSRRVAAHASALGVMVASTSVPANASANPVQPTAQPISTPPAPTGVHRWELARERLGHAGVDLQVSYIGEVLGNVSGGLQTGTVAEGLALFSLDLDLEKLIDWNGGAIRVNGIFPHGESPSFKLVGDLMTVSNIDAFRDDPVPYEAWFEQRLAQDRLHLRAGLLVADSEFAQTEAGSVFLNAAFGWPTGIAINTLNAGPSYFRSALGFRARYEPGPNGYVQAGIYDGDPFDGDPLGDGALSIGLGGDDGLFAIGESGYRWNRGSEALGLPGNAGVGAWFHTADFTRHAHPDGPAARHGGAFVFAEQTVWSNANPNAADHDTQPGQSLTAFARAAWSPADRAFSDVSGDLGLAISGILRCVHGDTLALGVAWMHTSTDLRNALAASGLPSLRAAEMAFECTWAIRLTPRWAIQPDYQWIHFAGDASDLADAHVLGGRILFDF